MRHAHIFHLDLLISMRALFVRGVISGGHEKPHFSAEFLEKGATHCRHSLCSNIVKIYAPCLMFLLRAVRVKVKNARTRLAAGGAIRELQQYFIAADNLESKMHLPIGRLGAGNNLRRGRCTSLLRRANHFETGG